MKMYDDNDDYGSSCDRMENDDDGGDGGGDSGCGGGLT